MKITRKQLKRIIKEELNRFTEATAPVDRQIGLAPGPLTLPGDDTWIYQWNTVEGVTGSPPPAESRPGDPPNPQPEASRPTNPQSPYPYYWWARRKDPSTMDSDDEKKDANGNDVWENLWTARFSTLNNELAYQILNEAFPIVPASPPDDE